MSSCVIPLTSRRLYVRSTHLDTASLSVLQTHAFGIAFAAKRVQEYEKDGFEYWLPTRRDFSIVSM